MTGNPVPGASPLFRAFRSLYLASSLSFRLPIIFLIVLMHLVIAEGCVLRADLWFSLSKSVADAIGINQPKTFIALFG